MTEFLKEHEDLHSDQESYIDDLDNTELNDDVELNNNAIELADNDIFDDNVENLDSDDSTSNIRLSELRIIQSTIDMPPQWGHRFNLVPAPEFVNYSGVSKIVQGIEDSSPYKYFNLLFSDDIIDQLVFQTNLYASQKYQASGTRFQSTNVVEIKTFLGILYSHSGTRDVPPGFRELAEDDSINYFDLNSMYF
ncbi:hypothetical protein NQ314_009927 [Rhamnusium bicolor]|uniref:PiggyBac transposable element-derived protein domain-containing protein n=1 Tax=Rhamnusium bicolor TaxID=1586634 RepID=A0AAV8XVU6_9CUCU|nr:hypothetical protein NQ314_009927 [Rhamnusium bicolor]